MYRILVCDDEKDIVSALKIYLTAEGYETVLCYNGLQALAALEENEIHLVLLDIMMPEMDGLSTLSRIREKYNVPVVLLTAKGEDTDKILGLGVGADDYVTKPFTPALLLARIRSHLRRYTELGSLERKKETDSLVVGDLSLFDSKKEVLLCGEKIALTPTEFEILKLLMQNEGKVISPREIYESVWHEVALGAENTVAVHVRHIREKLEIDPAEPKYLKVVWGQGYKLEGESL